MRGRHKRNCKICVGCVGFASPYSAPLLPYSPLLPCCCCCCVLTYAQFSSNWTRNVLRAAKLKPTPKPKTTRRRLAKVEALAIATYMLAIAIASSTENANFRWHAIVWLRLMTKVAHITGCHVPEIVSRREREGEGETERALNFFWRNLHELMLGRLMRSSSLSSWWLSSSWPLLRCSCYIRYLCLGRCQAVSSWKFRVITYADESGQTDSRSVHKVCLLWFIKNAMIVKFANTLPQVVPHSNIITQSYAIVCFADRLFFLGTINEQFSLFIKTRVRTPHQCQGLIASSRRKSGKLRMTAVINNGRAIKIKRQQQQQQQKRRHNAKKKLVK